MLMSLILSWANSQTAKDVADITSVKELVAQKSEVADYIDQQKGNEPHFVTISNLAQADQRDILERTFVLSLLPVLLVSGGVGWLISRYILKPVDESFASQERFIQDAAHELRNPLAAMNIAVSNQQSKDSDNFTKVVDRQTKRLIAITEDLLFLEKRQSGEKTEVANISNLTNDVIEDLTVLINEKSLTVNTSIAEDITYEINSNDYVVMIKNVIHNAVKYTPKKGSITVSLEQRKNGFIFEVEDTGIGISNADIQRLGERFFRAKNSGDIEGTGLGLSIVKKIVNLYSAELEINSKLKHGTKVTVKF
jgi:signal transduction histidine kinase